MNFNRIESQTERCFSIDFSLIEGNGHHPGALGNLNDDDAFDVMQTAFCDEAINRVNSDDPRSPLLGTGASLYIGFDAEWTELAPSVLGCLSYQFYCSGIGGDLAVICYPNSESIEDRLSLVDMIDEVVRLALSTGCVLTLPREIVIAGFMLRADLAVTADLPVFKRELVNVGGKVATANGGIDFEVVHHPKDVQRLTTAPSVVTRHNNASHISSTRFIDVSSHAPPRTALAVLGEALGIEKLELPSGYYKARMDHVKQNAFEFFRDYGVRDAEIAVRYWLHIIEFARKEVGVDDAPVSAGALAVQLCRKTFAENGMDYADLFDMKQKKVIDWNVSTGRRRTRKSWVTGDDRMFHERFAIEGFHGGRNECYACGPSEPGSWIDVDMIGAYTTGLVSVRQIAFRRSYETRRVDDFMGDVLGVAWISFRYPTNVRFPALPVRSAERGLIFPLAGETYATAPEIALAVRQGCRIAINRGVIWPWVDDPEDTRIFEPFVRKIRELRRAYADTPVLADYAKLLGNSVYGKTAQSLRDRTAFEIATSDSRMIGPSMITNATIATHVTGFVRAVIGEMLHGIPLNRVVASVTTDGFLTNAAEEEIDLSGPLCQRYIELCARVEA